MLKALLDREEKEKRKIGWSTCVNATPLDNVVGIQLKIANPVSRIIKISNFAGEKKKKKRTATFVFSQHACYKLLRRKLNLQNQLGEEGTKQQNRSLDNQLKHLEAHYQQSIWRLYGNCNLHLPMYQNTWQQLKKHSDHYQQSIKRLWKLHIYKHSKD